MLVHEIRHVQRANPPARQEKAIAPEELLSLNLGIAAPAGVRISMVFTAIAIVNVVLERALWIRFNLPNLSRHNS